MSALPPMTVREIRAGLAAREFSAIELTRATLERIGRDDARIHAFLEVTSAQALAVAAHVDDAVAAGRFSQLGPLAGVPIAFKDNMSLTGTRTTCASRVLREYRSPSTATCVQRCLDAGCIPLGKLNMDEFALGSSTETSALGVTRNPWDLERVPGGSSGGSAAAVAAGFVPVALGSDMGGSVRQPGGFCGVVAVKPAYGSVPHEGIVAFGDSLDQAGPLARSVEDAAITLNVLTGGGGRDARQGGFAVPVDFTANLAEGIAGMRIGVVASFMGAHGLADEVRLKVEEAVRNLGYLGARVAEVELPHARAAMAAYCVLGPCEIYENLVGSDSIRGVRASCACEDPQDPISIARAEGFGPEVRRRIMLGGYLRASEAGARYRRLAQQVRMRIRQDYARAFEKVDCIIAPVTPRTAFRFGEVSDPAEMYLSDMFTVSANIAGNGAMSMPVGFRSESGLPVGVQLIAPLLEDESMLRVAAALEGVYGIAPVASLHEQA